MTDNKVDFMVDPTLYCTLLIYCRLLFLLQMQVPPEMESALLQQVLSLTPEQLSSLPPEQQQEVIQLQQMLRQAS